MGGFIGYSKIIILSGYIILLIGSPCISSSLMDWIIGHKCCQPAPISDREICYSAEYRSTIVRLPLPMCSEKMGIEMLLYTRSNLLKADLLTRTSVPSTFDGRKLTMFFVHGWFGHKNDTYLKEIKDVALKAMDINFILVNWSKGAMTGNYLRVVANTKSAGMEVGVIAESLVLGGHTNRSMLYCVGHSLGAHSCGYAGSYFKFGRITGLDPASMLFTNFGPPIGLNSSSAELVDVWHTNGQGSVVLEGTMLRLGHVDFYPNAADSQPECKFSTSYNLPKASKFKGKSAFTDINAFSTGIDVLIPVCDHFSAVRFFIESMTNDCFLSRYKCNDQYQLPESCEKFDQPIQSMGMKTQSYNSTGIFYLETNADSPYCKN